MANFDEARTATEELFDNEQTIPTEEVPAEEIPTETVEAPTATEGTAEVEAAVETAEVASQVAQEKDTQLQQALQEIEALKAQNTEMQSTIKELSDKNKETIVEEALQMPTLDINGLAFADDETIANAQSQYAQQMSEFVKSGVLKELEPFITQAKQGQYEKEKAEAIENLKTVPELQGIEKMMPQLDKIIANNKWLQSDDVPVDEKYITAYAIARGVNAINTPVVEEQPKELTDDELMELYDKNPTFQELIEKKRLDAIKKQGQQVPPHSASSGAVNVALNILEKPKTFEEASERTRKMFGLE